MGFLAGLAFGSPLRRYENRLFFWGGVEVFRKVGGVRFLLAVFMLWGQVLRLFSFCVLVGGAARML